MLKQVNVNITDGDVIMPYLIEYSDLGDYDATNYNIRYYRDAQKRECWLDVYFGTEPEYDSTHHKHMFAQQNYWTGVEDVNWSVWQKDPTIDSLPIAALYAYFPQYSADTYDKNLNYIVKLTTHIQDWRVNIGCYLTKRIDSLACAPKRFLNIEYYEYQMYSLPDIHALIYSDVFKSLRFHILYGEDEEMSDFYEENDDCSLLCTEIIPVIEQDDIYIKSNTWLSSENAVEISKGDSDFMNLTIAPAFNANHESVIAAKMNFNNVFEGNLADYLTETYGINSSFISSGKIWIEYSLSAMNADNIYKMQNISVLVSDDPACTSVQFTGDDLVFENWAYLEKQIYFHCIASIVYRTGNREDEPILDLEADKLPITQELYKWWVQRDEIDNQINYVNLDNISDMNNINILAANKIVKNIYTMPRPENYKANILKPVFFKSYDIENIYIYSNANTTVAIKLSKFYSQVEYFKIQIGNYVETEYGRNAVGVLFKINASKLDKDVDSGTYYILNQDDEVVADGNFFYTDRLPVNQ